MRETKCVPLKETRAIQTIWALMTTLARGTSCTMLFAYGGHLNEAISDNHCHFVMRVLTQCWLNNLILIKLLIPGANYFL